MRASTPAAILAAGTSGSTIGRDEGLARLAANAVDQNPDVYFEIQADNPHSLGALERLRDAVEHVVGVVRTHRRERFAELIDEGRRKLPAGEDRRMADP